MAAQLLAGSGTVAAPAAGGRLSQLGGPPQPGRRLSPPAAAGGCSQPGRLGAGRRLRSRREAPQAPHHLASRSSLRATQSRVRWLAVRGAATPARWSGSEERFSGGESSSPRRHGGESSAARRRGAVGAARHRRAAGKASPCPPRAWAAQALLRASSRHGRPAGAGERERRVNALSLVAETKARSRSRTPPPVLLPLNETASCFAREELYPGAPSASERPPQRRGAPGHVWHASL